MTVLTAEQILAAQDAGLLKVAVPEWNGEVYVRVMSVGERDSYERMWLGKRDTGIENFRTEYLARVLCDEKGALLFTRDQVGALANKNGAVMSRLFDAAMKHNNMTEGDVEQLGKS
jgi:hypothetical protein